MKRVGRRTAPGLFLRLFIVQTVTVTIAPDGGSAAVAPADTEGTAGSPAAVLLPDPTVPWDPPARCVYRRLLREVIDPELGVNIIDLGLVYDFQVTDGIARLRMTMTTPGCPLTAYFDDAVHTALADAPGVDDIDLQIVWDPPWSPAMMSDEAKSQLGWRR